MINAVNEKNYSQYYLEGENVGNNTFSQSRVHFLLYVEEEKQSTSTILI